MRRNILVIFTLFLFSDLFSQSIEGSWYGVLKIQNIELRLIFNIEKRDTSYYATMDSPDQGAKGIPIQSVSFLNTILKISYPQASMEYSGVHMGDRIIGTFRQAGQSIPMNLTQRAPEGPKRPQEPKKPFEYYTEEVMFKNEKAGITLSGTLSLPSREGFFPCVILITGSGPQNRDEELMGHKPFLIIADHLTKNGIGVLRFDDRGVGKSGGVFSTATTLDFVSDVEAAVNYLKGRKEIAADKIGLIGHSEGGIVAPLVANNREDIAFIILLAGTGVKGSEIILAQQELIARATGVEEEKILKYKDLNQKIFKTIEKEEKNPELKNILLNLINTTSGGNAPLEVVKQQLDQLTSPWMLFFLKYDPAIALREVKCPLLAINGDKDLQVPSKVNLKAINDCFSKVGDPDNNFATKTNSDVTILEIEGLNHLFQEAKTGLPTEYPTIEQTISPKALNIITDWILKRVNPK
ncbi:MAG: alpha/beta hydrolase [Rikenellaceae bacterium]